MPQPEGSGWYATGQPKGGQDAQARILNRSAIGPHQFNIDQQTYIDGMPHVGRTDPLPSSDFHLAKMTQTDDGSCCYQDMLPDGDAGWADDDPSFGETWGALRP